MMQSMRLNFLARTPVFRSCIWWPRLMLCSVTADFLGQYRWMCQWYYLNLVSMKSPVCTMYTFLHSQDMLYIPGISLKCWHLSANIHSAKTQNNIIIIVQKLLWLVDSHSSLPLMSLNTKIQHYDWASAMQFTQNPSNCEAFWREGKRLFLLGYGGEEIISLIQIEKALCKGQITIWDTELRGL
jgi:hypothetical protein